jgi:hypothetical protein
MCQLVKKTLFANDQERIPREAGSVLTITYVNCPQRTIPETEGHKPSGMLAEESACDGNSRAK